LNRLLKLAFATVVVLQAPAAAQPYDPKDPRTILYSDTILRKAVADVAQMQEPELRAFAHYLAECSIDGPDDVSKHFCAAAMSAYEIEFGSDNAKRTLDSMIYARSGLKAWDTAHPDPGRFTTAKIVDESVKFAKTITALEEAARDRFRALRRK
jgi:hypothetical protein